jgi:hypothetical protein
MMYAIASAPLDAIHSGRVTGLPTGGRNDSQKAFDPTRFYETRALPHLHDFEGCHLAYPSCHSLLAWDDDTKGALFAVDRRQAPWPR